MNKETIELQTNFEKMKEWNNKRAFNEKKAVEKFWNLKAMFKEQSTNQTNKNQPK